METSSALLAGVLFVLLGALISGIVAFFFNSDNHRGSTAKEQAARRLALFEEVALHIGSMQHIFQKYRALVAESFRHMEAWPKTRRDELDKTREELAIAFRDLSMAESKLLLLGETNLQKILKIYVAKIAHFRKTYYLNKQGVTEEELNEVKKDVSTVKDKLFELLSKKYSKKLA